MTKDKKQKNVPKLEAANFAFVYYNKIKHSLRISAKKIVWTNNNRKKKKFVDLNIQLLRFGLVIKIPVN